VRGSGRRLTARPATGAAAVLVRAARRFRIRRRTGAAPRWRRWGILATVVAVALGTTGWFVADSSLFALRYVTVQGTSRLTPGEVLSAAAVRDGSSLVRLDPGVVARRVERLAPVADAVVSRRWPHGLVIHVTERRPAAVVVTGGRAELLDNTGVAFASVATAPSRLVTVHVSGPVPGAGDPAARTAMHVLAELPARIRARVSSLTARSVDNVSVKLADGTTVIWGSAADASTKSAVLRTLMRRSAKVYDVSTPAVAVTRG
jgi:cell division protein FtsQ